MKFAESIDLKCSHQTFTHTHTHTHTHRVTMRGDGSVNQFDCDNHFTMFTYIKTIQCTPYIHTIFICQLYLNKPEKNKKEYKGRA